MMDRILVLQHQLINNVKKLLTIAGSDSLSGGGIQADLATFNEFGYWLSVITSIVTVTNDNFKFTN